jgi:uncharacterized protein
MDSNKKNIVTWKVKGMHCASCVELVKQELSSLPQVEDAEVSLSRGEAVLKLKEGDGKPSMKEADSRLKPFGFSIISDDAGGPVNEAAGAAGKSDGKSDGKSVKRAAGGAFSWLKSLAAAGAVIALFSLLQSKGLVSFSGDNAGTPLLALIMGFAASVSSCLAVAGSIVISFSMLYQGGHEKNNSAFSSALVPNLVFHAGRIGSFTLLGGVLGLAGGSLSITGPLLGTVQIILVIFLLGASLSILGAGPLLGRFGLRMPASLSRMMVNLKAGGSPAAPLALGALTFFIPCGFTQSMQIAALGSGSFMSGALIMLAFSIGTFPVLLAAGLTALWSRRRGALVIQRAAGILIFFFAVITFFTALPLFSFSGNLFADDSAEKSGLPAAGSGIEAAAETGDVQNVDMHVTLRGFEPYEITVKKGVPVKWTIWGDQITGCTNAIIIPSLKKKIKLNDGANIVSFTPQQAGTINYSCWMGMVRGVIRVIE